MSNNHTMTEEKRWFPFGFGSETAAHRVFCLPFAGGGASFFLPWRKALPALALVPVQYPGRETRLNEDCHDSLDELVEALALALLPHLDRPYSLLGYSLGAKVGFALCHRLAELGAAQPQLFIPVAHGAPDSVPTIADVAALSDAEFRTLILQYGGMPQAVFDDPELANLLLPILRADLALASQRLALQPLSCPVLACAGSADAAARPAAMREWRRFTEAGFSLSTFEGGHFFARTASDFLPALAAMLGPRPHLPPQSPPRLAEALEYGTVD